MKLIAKPIRIEPAFDEPEQIRDMFERHAPYRALAAYAPDGVQDETLRKPSGPFFRGSGETGPWAASHLSTVPN